MWSVSSSTTNGEPRQLHANTNPRLKAFRYDPVYSDAKARAATLGEFNFFNAWMSQPKSQLKTFSAWAGKDSDIRYLNSPFQTSLASALPNTIKLLPLLAPCRYLLLDSARHCSAYPCRRERRDRHCHQRTLQLCSPDRRYNHPSRRLAICQKQQAQRDSRLHRKLDCTLKRGNTFCPTLVLHGGEGRSSIR